MIAFHLSRGVDYIIATDNGSTDATRSILERYRDQGVLHLIDEPAYTHDQSVWVTSMAHLAYERFGADWVIHSDADEFWWPSTGNLKRELASVSDRTLALRIGRYNYLPPARQNDGILPFYESMLVRERVSLNSVGNPLPPKVIHRGMSKITIADGNHAVLNKCKEIPALPYPDIEILHFPLRSYLQFERKIRQGATALESNVRVRSTQIGITWRTIYHDELLTGRLPAYYADMIPPIDANNPISADPNLIVDGRVRDALRDLHEHPNSVSK
jgi:hypothetical protein